MDIDVLQSLYVVVLITCPIPVGRYGFPNERNHCCRWQRRRIQSESLTGRAKTETNPHLHAALSSCRKVSHLWAADLQEVDGLPADVHVVGDVPQEHGNAVLHVPGDQGVALDPEVFVCTNSRFIQATFVLRQTAAPHTNTTRPPGLHSPQNFSRLV